MRIRCQDCGREYIVSARQVAQAYRLGGYTCERCEGEMQAAARSGEYLRARAEAYHRARALRHSGASEKAADWRAAEMRLSAKNVEQILLTAGAEYFKTGFFAKESMKGNIKDAMDANTAAYELRWAAYNLKCVCVIAAELELVEDEKEMLAKIQAEVVSGLGGKMGGNEDASDDQ